MSKPPEVVRAFCTPQAAITKTAGQGMMRHSPPA
jgi:hypothetical protein